MLRWIHKVSLRFRSLFQSGLVEQDLGEEIRFHLDRQMEIFISQGMPAEEARNAALREMGGVQQIKEECRDARRMNLVEHFLQDIRYGIRSIWAHKSLTTTVVLSLALGLGANIAIFSVLNAVLLRSLPVEDPQRLVSIRFGENSRSTFTNPLWEQIRDHQQAFSGVLAFSDESFDLAERGERRVSRGLWVSGDFFRVLGVPPLLGRVFTQRDDRHGGGVAGPVAVISYSFWKRNFGGDISIVGKTVRLNRHPFEIVGVTPPWFSGLDTDYTYDVAIPIGCEPLLHTDGSALEQRSWWWLRILGRLPTGISLQPAEDRMKSIATGIFKATLPPHYFPEDQKEYLKNTFTLRPATTGFSGTRDEYRKALLTLLAIVGVVLLVACANIANLLLARAAARQREISVRMAIGASRSRVIRQLLTESLLLTSLGATGGFLFALWGSRLLVRLISTTGNQLEINLSPDLKVIAFTVGVAILTTLLFGLAPAFRATRITLNQVLKKNTGSAIQGSSRFNLGKVLVTGQIALSLLLLVGAFLFLGNLRNLLNIDPGFSHRNLLLIKADVQQENLPRSQRVRLYQEIRERLEKVPGVDMVSSSDIIPISHTEWNEWTYPEGYQAKSREDTLVWFNRVSPGYFKTMHTPLLLGRDFSERDNLNSPKVVIVSEATARHFWGTAHPIGKTIGGDKHQGQPGEKDYYQVVGVVKDSKYVRIDETIVRTAYLPSGQDSNPSSFINYEIRSGASRAVLIPALRSAIAEVNRDLSLEFRDFETQVNESIVQQRVVALLASIFGALALLLSLVGIYGVTDYAVSRRQREIGIRMALGALQSSMVWLVLRDMLILLLIGSSLGLAASLAMGRLIASLLYGIHPTDPGLLAGATLALAAAAALAAYLPARKAVRLNPMTVLRDE
jgi:putative ABC transport system permease protein